MSRNWHRYIPVKGKTMAAFDDLVHDLSELDEVEAIALGGSRATGEAEASSDYDLYVYTTARIPEELRREVLDRHCSYMEIGNEYWELEDDCTLNDGIDIDVIYRSLDAITEEVAAVVEGHEARNGYTTCTWDNLLHCKVLYDRDGRLAAAIGRFDVPYPLELRANAVRRNWELLHGKIPSYDRQIKKALRRGDRVAANHRTTAFLESYFDLLFALNRQPHPGEKRMALRARERCEVLPEDFEENLDLLLRLVQEDPEEAERQLDVVVDSVRSIIPPELQ